jgi:tetratricopeptide (TPR) repeat protein
VQYLRTGALAEARDTAMRAMPVLQGIPGPAGGAAAAAIDVLGLAALVEGELDGAASAFQRALDLLAVTLGTDHPSHAEVAIHLAQVRIDQGRHADALALLGPARDTLATTVGDGHPAALLAAAVDAEARLATGEREAIEAPLRAFLDSSATDRWQRARTSIALATVLEREPEHRLEAVDLQRRAKADFQATGDRTRPAL